MVTHKLLGQSPPKQSLEFKQACPILHGEQDPPQSTSVSSLSLMKWVQHPKEGASVGDAVGAGVRDLEGSVVGLSVGCTARVGSVVALENHFKEECDKHKLALLPNEGPMDDPSEVCDEYRLLSLNEPIDENEYTVLALKEPIEHIEPMEPIGPMEEPMEPIELKEPMELIELKEPVELEKPINNENLELMEPMEEPMEPIEMKELIEPMELKELHKTCLTSVSAFIRPFFINVEFTIGAKEDTFRP